MSMLTVRGTGPLSLSSVALATGGSPVAPPMRTTALCLVEKLSVPSTACVEIRYTPALESVTVVAEPEPMKQHHPLAPPPWPTQRSHFTGPPSGSVAGKLTVIVEPTGASVGETVRIPDGGCPGFEAGETTTYWRPCAPPPRPSATETS